jgi:hypothetical protein
VLHFWGHSPLYLFSYLPVPFLKYHQDNTSNESPLITRKTQPSPERRRRTNAAFTQSSPEPFEPFKPYPRATLKKRVIPKRRTFATGRSPPRNGERRTGR